MTVSLVNNEGRAVSVDNAARSDHMLCMLRLHGLFAVNNLLDLLADILH